MRKAFPESCFLINPVNTDPARNSFKMRLRGEVRWSELKTLPGDPYVSISGFTGGPREWSPRGRSTSHSLFDLTTQCDVLEAFLIIRPYLKQISGSLTGSLTGSDWEIVFTMDGDIVGKGPFTQFLIHQDQDPRLDIPLPRDLDPRSSIFYGVHVLDGKPVHTLPSIGHFAPNGTRLQIRARDLTCLENTVLEVGVIAARYGPPGVRNN